jgi:hypothetical protein
MSEPHYSFPQRTPVFTAVVVLLCFAAFGWFARRYYTPTSGGSIAPAAAEFAEDARWKATPQGRADRLAELHQKERAANAYAWADQPAGIVRLPLDRAIELTVKEHAKK